MAKLTTAEFIEAIKELTVLSEGPRQSGSSPSPWPRPPYFWRSAESGWTACHRSPPGTGTAPRRRPARSVRRTAGRSTPAGGFS